MVAFEGRGRIAPLGDVPLIAPPDLVCQVAALAAWPESPDLVAANVLAVADVLSLAGWSRAPHAGPSPLVAPTPPPHSTPWPPTWVK